MFIWVKSHIIIPQGMADIIALDNTKIVLLIIELYRIFNTWGFLYGGNSKTKFEEEPFNIVFDKIFEVINVSIIPSRTIKHTIIVAMRLDFNVWPDIKEPLKNIVAIVIKKGKRPLHGTKLFVKIAISRSRFELIILVPMTPAALHPNPIHIVRHCFPEVLHFWKHLSKLKEIRGKNPRSSNNVNKGKKIAIGGSITLIIHVTVLYTPSIIKENNQGVVCIFSKKISKYFFINKKKFDNNMEG